MGEGVSIPAVRQRLFGATVALILATNACASTAPMPTPAPTTTSATGQPAPTPQGSAIAAASEAHASSSPITAGVATSVPVSTPAMVSPPATATPGPTATPTATTASARDTLRMHWLGDLTPLWHPEAFETFGQATAFGLVFSTLVDHCWTDATTVEFCGDLAYSWSTPDAKTYSFAIHQGVTWQDGEPFSVDDIVWTIAESKKWSPGRYKNEAWDAVATARKTGDATLVITLNHPDADWLNAVTDPDAVILPRHLLRDLLTGVSPDGVNATIETSQFATTAPIGTGPYRLVRWLNGQYAEFEASPTYFRGPPPIAHVFLLQLTGENALTKGAAGDLDLSVRLNPAEASAVRAMRHLDTIVSPGVGTFGPQFNLLSACDLQCRKAVSHGIDAPGIVRGIYGGLATLNRGVNPGMPAADDQEYFDYDPIKARAELAKSSWDVAEPLRILIDPTFAGAEQWAPVVQQDLEAIGFSVELTLAEQPAAAEVQNDLRKWEITMMQGGDQGVGPFHQQPYYACRVEDPPFWKSTPRDCRIDDLFVQARLEPDPARQLALFKEISSLTNKLVDKTSLWTASALSFRDRCLQGVVIPRNTREFIVGAERWLFTC